ncbi:unnamed protein product [Lepeophtheirus salmonis]|uniref:(salmon louse) hypothetical protein n=1 Tax=Lepeophtheirus salmonis TaxID=72036 RepID=A0A7R8H6Z1_LEPSM|nr:unnamed protein product [Lepeophtheirus salmonis]CAF2892039.1 unnamed protein product [Lepeophtheirus salmonis]
MTQPMSEPLSLDLFDTPMIEVSSTCSTPTITDNSLLFIPPQDVPSIYAKQKRSNSALESEERKGSSKDVENLSDLFEHLKFITKIVENPTRKEFMREVRSFAEDSDHEKIDMMALAVLSHGRNGMIITHEGAKVDTEWIYSQFNNQKCPLLKGKPKFFIIQACRGDETDKAILQGQKNRLESFSPASRKRRPPTSVDTDTQYAGSSIIAYSTIPGYVSIRDRESGTWFIQSLCQTFFQHAHENNLIDLLMKTSEVLSRYSNEKNEKQTCNIELRHMYKRLYFNADISVTSLPNQRIAGILNRSLSTPPASPAVHSNLIDED